MMRLWLGSLALAGILAGGLAAQGVKQHIEYVADIDDWRVAVYAGAANADGFLQGPLREAGIGRNAWSMCFFPDGQGFMAVDGVVMTFTQDGIVRFLAGNPGLAGYQDGPAAEALLGRQISICPDGKGGLWLGDRSNRCIRRLSKQAGRWTVETVAGDPHSAVSAKQLEQVREEGKLPDAQNRPTDGHGKKAVFAYLHSNISADADGNAWIVDSDFLRKIAPDGEVSTLNPQGGSGLPAKEEREPLATAKFRLIMGGGICFGGDGHLYVADRWNHCIRKVDLKEKLVSIAVGPGGGYVDGPEKNCGFHDSPGSIVYDPYRQRFYTTGVDDWGLRVWEKGHLKSIAGGNNKNKAFEGPAKESSLHWSRVVAVDPRPPHDIYFVSGGPVWDGRLGRLFKATDPAKKGGGQ